MIRIIDIDDMGTPRTDEVTFVKMRILDNRGTIYEVVDADFARQLEQENKNLRNLLDKASRAIACFVDLRGMTASELKSAHNGICILLSATKMLDAIKTSARNEKEAEDKAATILKETGQG